MLKPRKNELLDGEIAPIKEEQGRKKYVSKREGNTISYTPFGTLDRNGRGPFSKPTELLGQKEEQKSKAKK